jgi:hypothetical protein
MKYSDRVNKVTMHLCYEILPLILLFSVPPSATTTIIIVFVILVAIGHLVIIIQALTPHE